MSTEQTIQIGEQKLKIKRRDAKSENAVMNCEKNEKGAASLSATLRVVG